MMNILERVKRKLNKDYDAEKIRVGGAKIGKNFKSYGSYIDPSFLFLIEIGDNVTLSHSTILAHDASPQHALKKSRVGKIEIGCNVFVGFQSIILPNVRIGSNVVIGAGSVVVNDIPDNSIAVGNPCKVIGTYDGFVEKHKEAMKTHPVYPTYHSKKSKAEIKQMQEELNGTWGYDE